MAKKTYTVQDREDIREQLLDLGQRSFSQKGYREASLKEIYEAVGISKAFFYTFFPSKEALAIQVLLRQRTKMLERARKVAQESASWRGSLETVFDLFFHGDRHGVFVLELDDLPHLCRHMSQHELQDFEMGLTQFYQALLELWNIPVTAGQCHLIQNMVNTLLLSYHSHLYSSFPFHPGVDEETVSLQIRLIIDYLEGIYRNA